MIESFGEFADMNTLRAAAQSDAFKFVLADYDQNWSAKGVTRTRDIMEKAQYLSGSPIGCRTCAKTSQ
jgi:hypothetical protein